MALTSAALASAMLLPACRYGLADADVSTSLDAATHVAPLQAHTFKHVFVIVLENEGLAQVQADGYFADLARRGVLLTHYAAVAHPSQPNYLALIAGDTFVTDDAPVDLAQRNLTDLLASGGVSWKTYQENYPGGCYTEAISDGGLYARKHNPFISFDSIRANPSRCAKIVNASALQADIQAMSLPGVAFYVPNQANDGHDTGLAFASAWLKAFLEPKLADAAFMDGTLVIVTFDESGTFSNNHNQVYTVLLGPPVVPSIDAHPYTHYDLLRSIEINFGLGSLGRRDAKANGFARSDFKAAARP